MPDPDAHVPKDDAPQHLPESRSCQSIAHTRHEGTIIADHDSYIAAAPEQFRPIFEHLRKLLREALPDAEEMTAYDMPGFRMNGTVVASYAAFSKQLGLYVLGPAIADHADDIAEAGLKASKTGVTFSPRKPIPDELVTGLAQASAKYAQS